MILKEKAPIPANDPRTKSGDDAERQMAHYLKREFGKQKDCFVLNDLRLVHEDEVAQIDHLLVTKFGFFVIESKAGDINVDARGQWFRVRDGGATGMPSAVIQAERQGGLLRELIQANREVLRGKYLFGKLQGGFLGALVECFVGVSDKGIISAQVDIPNLDKADNIPRLIRSRLQALEDKHKLLSVRNLFSTDVLWEMRVVEAEAVANFLLHQHQPGTHPGVVVKEVSLIPQVNPVATTKTRFIPRAGAACPLCDQGKLERRSVRRADGTETDFLSCSRYPEHCKAIFPLVALTLPTESDLAEPKTNNTSAPSREGAPCPKCKTGQLVKRLGKNGKPHFLGCSNFPKTKCGHMEGID